MTMEQLVYLLKNYWAQITLLLGVLGYIIKIILENYLKLKEIKFSHSRSAIVNETKKLYATFDFFNYKMCQVFPMLNKSKKVDILITELENHFINFNSDLLSLKILLEKSQGAFLDQVQDKMREIYLIFLISYYAIEMKWEIKEPGKGFDKIDEFYQNEYPEFKLKFENDLRNLIGT